MTTIDRQASEKLHRRAVRREIVLPFLGGLLLIIVLMVVAFAAGRTPVSGVANTMLTILILCPMALCLFPIYLVLIVALVGMNRAHNSVAKPLRRLELLTISMRERSYAIADRMARQSINLNARFAPLDRLLFSAFDRPAQQEDDHE